MNDPIERNEGLPAGEFVDFGRITDETKASGIRPYLEQDGVFTQHPL